MQRLIENLAATAELMDKQLTPSSLAMMADDLSMYDENIVIIALKNLRREASRFTLDAIIKQIELLNPDGRIGADEAWALYPHNEADSAVITEEMAQAMQVAQPLLLEGDKIAARMSFKEAYNRITTQNKMNGIKPKWFPSLGHRKEGRDIVIAEAVRLGRLTKEHALSLLPPPVDYEFTNNLIQLKQTMALQDKTLAPEQMQKNHERITAIKAMLRGS